MIGLFRIVFGIVPLIAVGWQLARHVELGYSIVAFFSYFTILSNLFAACMLLIGARQEPATPTGRTMTVLRLMAAIDMTVVGVVFSILLRNVDLGGLRPWVNLIVHYLMPCVVLLDWILWPPRRALRWRELGWCLLFPLLYLGFTLLRGAQTGWYPYPFLNPAEVGGYGGVALYAAGITVFFFMAGLALIFIANRRRRAGRRRAGASAPVQQ